MSLEAQNLNDLPPEMKRELVRILWTKKKIKEANTLQNWKPWEPGQASVFKSKTRMRLCLGGNRSGKTECGAADVSHMFLGTHPYRENRIPIVIKAVATDFPNTLRNAIIPKVLKFLPRASIHKMERNQQGIVQRIIGINDSILDFMSYDQESIKFESWDADMIWFDEPPPEDIYKGARRGLVDRAGTILFTMTPISEPWFYDKLWLPAIEGRSKDTEIFVLDTNLNPHLPPEEVEAMKDVYEGEELEARLHGHFLHLSGLIYKAFRRELHLVPYFDWPTDWPVWMCIDPHPKKAHAVTWIGITNKEQKVILDELKIECSIQDLAAKIHSKETQNKYRVVDRLIDTSIKALDRVDQRKILADAGLRCRFPKKHDDVDPGIQRVQQLLQPRKTKQGGLWMELVVRDNCKGHVSEFMSYMWDKGGKPKKEKDDYMDNVRYITGVHPRFEYNPQTVQYVKGFYV